MPLCRAPCGSAGTVSLCYPPVDQRGYSQLVVNKLIEGPRGKNKFTFYPSSHFGVENSHFEKTNFLKHKEFFLKINIKNKKEYV